MCEHGNTVIVKDVFVPPSASSTGKGKMIDVTVDSCIAPLVRSLNNAGFRTIACCCGHGIQPGNIAFELNGEVREMVIVTFDQARVVYKIFPLIRLLVFLKNTYKTFFRRRQKG